MRQDHGASSINFAALGRRIEKFAGLDVLEVEYSWLVGIRNCVFLKSLIKRNFEMLRQHGHILLPKSNRIAGSATGAALLAMEEKMAGHAIVINRGVFGLRHIGIDLLVGLCCGPEEDNCDFSRIFL